ncbi:MAG: ThuA domain-containing protein [Armatimonadetes bacterium]|nr:ThuA domain-containing protein [Armatimonadota bacterium]
MLTAALLAATVMDQQNQIRIPETGVLVFSKTAGFRHGSIEAGKEMFKKLALEHAWMVWYSEDAAEFTPEKLGKYQVIVFLNTTGDILDESQQKAMEAWYGPGRGFVGIHAAADTEYDWEWYGKLVGAYFKGHPAQQEADVILEDREHPATKHLPAVWHRKDEWYDYRVNPRTNVRVLARVDTSTYEGHSMGDDHPITWCQEYKSGGRSFYTGLGHTDESYTEQAFVEMIGQAVNWASKRQ